jgi:uncharacterized membrane protein
MLGCFARGGKGGAMTGHHDMTVIWRLLLLIGLLCFLFVLSSWFLSKQWMEIQKTKGELASSKEEILRLKSSSEKEALDEK